MESILAHYDPSKLPLFSFQNKRFTAKPCEIYDGDTFSAIFEYRGEIIKYRCRCYGYDSPEMKPLLSKENREQEIAAAHKAKERFTELLQRGTNGLVEIHCGDFDKYGRILVTVYNESEAISINSTMLTEGHGKTYMGGHKS